jgi:hypothetical protein
VPDGIRNTGFKFDEMGMVLDRFCAETNMAADLIGIKAVKSPVLTRIKGRVTILEFGFRIKITARLAVHKLRRYDRQTCLQRNKQFSFHREKNVTLLGCTTYT